MGPFLVAFNVTKYMFYRFLTAVGKGDSELKEVTMKKDQVKLELKNEYASLELTIDYNANGLRLKIIDLLSGKVCYFDPLQIECLLRMDSELLDAYLPY
jgi:hypothetical protein